MKLVMALILFGLAFAVGYCLHRHEPACYAPCPVLHQPGLTVSFRAT